MSIRQTSRVLFVLEAVLLAVILLLALVLLSQVVPNVIFAHGLASRLFGAIFAFALLAMSAASAVLLAIAVSASQAATVRVSSLWNTTWPIAILGAVIAVAGFMYAALFETLDESGFTGKSVFGPFLFLWAPIFHIWLTTRGRHLFSV
jgi:hypothetical protein